MRDGVKSRFFLRFLTQLALHHRGPTSTTLTKATPSLYDRRDCNMLETLGLSMDGVNKYVINTMTS